MKVTILETGVANVASVRAAFQRLNRQTVGTDNPEDVQSADYLVIPGVGSFAAGMATLEARGLVESIQRRIAEGLPTLAICLGLQLLAERSEESPGVAGLSCIPGSVTAFPDTVCRPQFGWNWLANESADVLGGGGYVYYANSYRLIQSPSGWCSGWSDHGGTFVGCLQKGAVVACQFHPELSGAYGTQILERWLAMGGGGPC